MDDERKNTGIWPWVVALLVGLPALYVLSIGPACWITSFVELDDDSVSIIYQPVMRARWRGLPPDQDDILHRYCRIASRPEWDLMQLTESKQYSWGRWH
jgi:hypothetical protein